MKKDLNPFVIQRLRIKSLYVKYEKAYRNYKKMLQLQKVEKKKRKKLNFILSLRNNIN